MAEAPKNQDLGQLLLEEGLVDESQLQAARNAQREQGKSIGRALMDMGAISDQTRLRFCHEQFGYEIVDLGGVDVEPDILTRISLSYAERHRCAPILIEDGKLVVAMDDPTDIVVLDEIKQEAGMEVLPVLAPITDIEHILTQYPRMTQAQADALRQRMQAPLWWRLLHPLLFLVIMVAPLFLFGMLVAQGQNTISRWVLRNMGTSPFDIVLYLILGWALWSIIIWEIDGLIFGSPEET